MTLAESELAKLKAQVELSPKRGGWGICGLKGRGILFLCHSREGGNPVILMSFLQLSFKKSIEIKKIASIFKKHGAVSLLSHKCPCLKIWIK